MQGSPGIPNWPIYIDSNHNGKYDTGEPLTYTDANGNYAFTGLANGTYTVAEIQQTNWTQTAPTTGNPVGTYQITVSGGQIVTGVDFGNKS